MLPTHTPCPFSALLHDVSFAFASFRSHSHFTHKQAMATQLSIGFCYSWSIMNDPLTRMIGVVAPASSDWALQ